MTPIPMPIPPSDEAWLTAALDGELDAEHQLALERRLAEDPAFRAEWDRRVALRDAIRAHGRVHAPPPALEARLRRLALGLQGAVDDDADDDGATSRGAFATMRRAGAFDRRAWLLAAGSAVAASIVTAVIVRVPLPVQPAEPDALLAMADDAVAGHARALVSERMIEVESTSQHTVRPWLTSKLPFATPVPDLSAKGFELVGARRELVGTRTAAALVYKRRLHLVSAVATPQAGPDRAPVAHVLRSFNTVSFVHAGTAWCLVSDLNAKELGDLAEDLRAAS